MAKLYKVEMYLLDINDNYDSLEDIVETIKNTTELMPDYFRSDKVIFYWDDNLPINFDDCTKEDYESIFIQR